MTCDDDDEITQSFKIKILVKKSEMKFLKSLCYNGNLYTFIATLYYANQFQSFLGEINKFWLVKQKINKFSLLFFLFFLPFFVKYSDPCVSMVINLYMVWIQTNKRKKKKIEWIENQYGEIINTHNSGITTKPTTAKVNLACWQ